MVGGIVLAIAVPLRCQPVVAACQIERVGVQMIMPDVELAATIRATRLRIRGCALHKAFVGRTPTIHPRLEAEHQNGKEALVDASRMDRLWYD